MPSKQILQGQNKMFKADFFDKLGPLKIKPFEKDLETLDMKSSFLQGLKRSLKVNRWMENKPLILAVAMFPNSPDADDINGQVIDGRHRCMAWQLLKDDGGNPPKPVFQVEQIRDITHLLARRAHYELSNQSKNMQVSQKHATKIILRLMKDNLERMKTLDEAHDFFSENGLELDDDKQDLLHSIYSRFKAQALRKERKSTQQGRSSTLMDDFVNSMGKAGVKPPTNILPTSDEGRTVSLLCPECSEVLICPKCHKLVYLIQYDDGNIAIKHLEVASH